MDLKWLTNITSFFKPAAHWTNSALKGPWFSSLYEVAFTLVVSNAMIFLAAYIHILIKSDGIVFADALSIIFNEKIKPTELIGFVMGFIAPSLWIMFTNLRIWKHSWLWLLFCVLQIVVVVCSSVVFALAVSSTLVNSETAQLSAYWFLWTALIVWYFTLVYQKAVLNGINKQFSMPRPGKESGSDVMAALKG